MNGVSVPDTPFARSRNTPRQQIRYIARVPEAETQKHEGHQLDDCRRLSGCHPAASSANIQPGKRAIRPDNQPGTSKGHGKPGHQQCHGVCEECRHGGIRESAVGGEQEHPHHLAGHRSERRSRVRIKPPGTGDPAPCLGEAEGYQPHDDGAHDIGKDCGCPEVTRSKSRHSEDPGAHGDAHDHECQRTNADDPPQSDAVHQTSAGVRQGPDHAIIHSCSAPTASGSVLESTLARAVSRGRRSRPPDRRRGRS